MSKFIEKFNIPRPHNDGICINPFEERVYYNANDIQDFIVEKHKYRK